MGKITEIELVGKVYPMSFSAMASKQLAKKYGTIESLGEMFSGKRQGTTEADIDVVTYILCLLIAQGCAYKNYFEKNVPPPKNAPVDEEGKWIPLPQEAIEIALQMDDFGRVKEAIETCISGGKEKELTATPVGKKAEARQE